MTPVSILNLPRPKSHIEAAYTGAVKNFWGIIPGGEKAQCHLYGKDPMAFGNVIIDNYETMKNLNKKEHRHHGRPYHYGGPRADRPQAPSGKRGSL